MEWIVKDWTVHKDDSDYSVVEGNRRIAGYIVGKENATLIASAPDLFAAIDNAMEYLDDTLGPCDDDCECILHPLKAALKKAGKRTKAETIRAAAPELLEALKALRQNVDKDLSGYWTESTSNFMQQADAAIAKAEGR